jgi:WhiB family transcriptional regulator, redox-sensing transcriptional regulator
MTVHTGWRHDAACLDADPELFFPIGTASAASRQAQEAKRICRTCPAQVQCLAWALENGVTDGVWGGRTAEERRAIRSRERRAGTGVPVSGELERHVRVRVERVSQGNAVVAVGDVRLGQQNRR